MVEPEKKMMLNRVEINIWKTNKERWNNTEKFTAFNMEQINDNVSEILYKHGRITKGSYRFSIKGFEQTPEGNAKPVFTSMHIWRGTLESIKKYIEFYTKRKTFIADLIPKIEKALNKRSKEIGKELSNKK